MAVILPEYDKSIDDIQNTWIWVNGFVVLKGDELVGVKYTVNLPPSESYRSPRPLVSIFVEAFLP